ncbi:hypothetical protein BDQ94DRAFT_93584 [Aspergillus welwitschiae]|uniref:Uncharacterized protein n=1 Tax=Aspergillus welwitschiae TaxID=1341132 RepID=A0A3F3PPQ1_9EURO|nr:hypothetical protein BDQ94DRAFT_93584 [Aspergillus welwitschiae]RDH28899.1 hypothetical protein BDQ94DRAFT_93584 [Aspergillus welwitschiae]
MGRCQSRHPRMTSSLTVTGTPTENQSLSLSSEYVTLRGCRRRSDTMTQGKKSCNSPLLLAGKLKTVTNASRTHGVMAGDAGTKAWREGQKRSSHGTVRKGDWKSIHSHRSSRLLTSPSKTYSIGRTDNPGRSTIVFLDGKEG